MRRILSSVFHWTVNSALFFAGKRDYLSLYPALTSRNHVYSRHSRRILRFDLRPGTVDFYTLIEVLQKEHYRTRFLKRHDELLATYDGILRSGRTPLIVDCGANIGLSAAYFADRFAAARVVAVEPDAGNAGMIRKNTAGLNVDVLRAAVTSRRQRLSIMDRKSAANAFRTRHDENGDIEGVSVADICRRYPSRQFAPFLIKIDIEGFERDLFAENTGWIGDFPLIVVELHDWILPGEGNATNFLKAIARHDRDFVYQGDNVFSIRNDGAVASSRFRAAG